MATETILITGGTGLIGRALTKILLEQGFRVVILSRDPARHSSSNPLLSYAGWDVAAQQIDREAIAAADHVVHLAGAGVAEKRWTKRRKLEIVDSRVKSGELLVTAMTDTPNQIRSVISSSAIGWYGPDPVIPNPKPFTENDPADSAFLGATCEKWEQSIQPVRDRGKRLVLLRTGIVLSPEGGAFREFIKPLRFGLATVLGNGRQVVSWIHIADLVGMILYAIQKESIEGPYNAVAPNPVSNRALILQLAKSRGKFYLPVYVPAFVLKWVLGEMSIEVLKSATVSSSKILGAGFTFSYPRIADAVENLLKTG